MIQLTEDSAYSDVRAGLYSFFAAMALTPIPPDETEYAAKLIDALNQLPEVDESDNLYEGIQVLKRFADDIADADDEDLAKLQTQLAVDRTRLFRGLQPKQKPEAPFESVYRPTSQINKRLLDVINAYTEAGLRAIVPSGERGDYIGVELKFMACLCAKESEATAEEKEIILEHERRFLTEHLLRWVPKFCKQMLDAAQTDFFRGIALVLPAFLDQEAALFQPAP